MNIENYTGINIPNVLKNPYHKSAYIDNWNQLHLNYGDNVEFQRLSQQILLCDETRDYLYSDKAIPKPSYKKGSRPYLEKVVDDCIKACKTDREKVLAILDFCSRLSLKFGDTTLFYGGTEEELIKKGDQLCETLGRLMTALLEVAGIPARIVMLLVGHIVAEAYVDGKWGYFDPRYGFFVTKSDGSFASIDELWQDRELILKQDDLWKSHLCTEKLSFDTIIKKNYDRYFNPNDVFLFCNYSLSDFEKYNYEWKCYDMVMNDPKFKTACAKYGKSINDFMNN